MLIAIEVKHHSEVHGNYTREFKAIPADVAAPHYTDVHVFAKAENQPAQVKDNNDPEGLGRIKVQFYGVSSNIVSEWIRMIQPHSGAGKGFYFIPEIGEEVLVGFEGNNVQNPYVMGTQYNGNESSGYSSPQNDIKVIQTRSGIKMIFNDGDGSVSIEDPSGNTWKMDGQGNIYVNALKNFTVNAGDNFTVTAGKNISLSAGENIDNSANKNIVQNAGQDISQNAAGNITEQSDNRTEISTEISSRQSRKSELFSDEIQINSTKDIFSNIEIQRLINENTYLTRFVDSPSPLREYSGNYCMAAAERGISELLQDDKSFYAVERNTHKRKNSVFFTGKTAIDRGNAMHGLGNVKSKWEFDKYKIDHDLLKKINSAKDDQDADKIFKDVNNDIITISEESKKALYNLFLNDISSVFGFHVYYFCIVGGFHTLILVIDSTKGPCESTYKMYDQHGVKSKGQGDLSEIGEGFRAQTSFNFANLCVNRFNSGKTKYWDSTKTYLWKIQKK